MSVDRGMDAEMIAVAKKAAVALGEFPLPAGGLTSIENYRRILDWLYSGDVASLVVGISYGMRKGQSVAER